MESITSQINDWQNYVLLILTILVVSLVFILLVLIFPLFVFVKVTNREWDKKTSIYPITNHFFKAVCWFYLFLFIFVIDLLIEWSYISNNEKYEFGFFPWWLSFMIVISHTHHIILSFLALQRFLIYFFPSSEKYFSPKNLILALRFCYFVVFIVFWIIMCTSNIDGGFEYSGLLVYYIALHIILFFCAALYIPIVVSIKKLQNLASSAIKNKPHKYILYQTIIIVSSKTVHLIFLYYLPIGDKLIIGWCSLDIISTPLTIQMTYLLCNRRTLNTIRKQLTLSNIYRTVFKRSSVEPSVQEVNATTVVPPT